MSSSGSSWRAADSLQIREQYTFNWVTVASGKADTGEFHPGTYRGIYTYANLNFPSAGHYVLPIVAAVSRSQTSLHTRNLLGIEDNAAQGGVTALAIAHTEFVRPKYQFDPIGADEYASLFNPFWQARLVGSSIVDLPQALQVKSTWRGQ